MKQKKSVVTAEELLAKLQGNPEFVLKQQQQNDRAHALEAQLCAEQRQLLDDLQKVGVQVSSVWDLVNTKKSYADAIPVLVRHLTQAYHDSVREGIARALTVREAEGFAGQVILNEIKRMADQPGSVRWALANALTKCADAKNLKDIGELVNNHKYKDEHKVLKIAARRIEARAAAQIKKN